MTRPQETLLHTYVFDAFGKLLKSITSDQYEINYAYDKGQQLATITQSDSSLISFDYYQDIANQNKLQNIQVGSGPANTFNFSYQDHLTIFKGASGAEAKLAYNDQSQPLSFLFADEAMQYRFNPAGQVEHIVYTDGSEEDFVYDAQGFLFSETHKDKTTTTYHYSDGAMHLLLAKTNSAPSAQAPGRISYYVYDTQFNNDHAVLRYEISPMGRVKEHGWNADGHIENERTYLADFFPARPGLAVPSLSEMDGWKKLLQQNGQMSNTALAHYEHDPQGRLVHVQQFAGADGQGQGINNEQTVEKSLSYDGRGRLTKKAIKYGVDQFYQEELNYDGLDRRTKESIGSGELTQETICTYQNNQTIKQLPNGRTETQVFNDTGRLQQEGATVEVDGKQQTRIYQYQYDSKERIETVMQPDTGNVFRIYDQKQRPIATITPSGIVTTFEYNAPYRYQIKKEHANLLDVSQLCPVLTRWRWWTGQTSSPTQALFQQALAKIIDPDQDRVTYTFFDVRGNVQFEIDPEGHLAGCQYDDHGQLLHRITYAEKATADELQNLLQGRAVQRLPDRQIDQVVTTFHDGDSHLIAEQDRGGYLAELQRDAGGRVSEKINYATPNLDINSDLAVLRPPPDQKNDAHIYYFYDALSQHHTVVNAEGQLTTHTYTTDGKKQSTKHYASLVGQDWYDHTEQPPQVITNTKDEETHYTYDGLRRLISISKPNGATTSNAYDEMGHVTAHYVRDRSALTNVDGDHCRGQEHRYGTWEQKIIYANAFVAQQLAKIDLLEISDEEKQREKDSVLEKNAEHSHYDSTGLKLKTVDPLGNVTFYYYDKERRPVLSINATGAVIENKYNAFGEMTEERQYYLSIAKEVLANLTGGQDNNDVRALIKGHPKDRATAYARDKRGQTKEKTDAEGHISSYEYDAFKQCKLEHLPVNGLSPALHIGHQYDGRGLEIKTVRSTNDGEIVAEHRYDHYLAKQTGFINELGGREQFVRDRLGRVKERQQCPSPDKAPEKMIVIEKTTYDAFSREFEKQYLGQSPISIEHDVQTRTKTVTHAGDGGQTITTANVFGEEVSIIKKSSGQESALHAESKQHAPDGQLQGVTDGLGASAQTEFDLVGNKKYESSADNIKTAYHYDGAYHRTSMVKDADDASGLNLKTTYVRNSFGQAETIIAPRGTITQNEFDRCDGLVKETRDAGEENTLNLITTTFSYNAQGQRTHKIQGDAQQSGQYHEQKTWDDQGRLQTTNIDPEGLNIKREYQYGAMGNVVLEKTAEGNTKRYFYDVFQRKCFAIADCLDAQVNGMAYHYTDAGKLKSTRKYANAINKGLITDKIQLADLSGLFQTSADDTVVLYFQDQNGREHYKAKLLFDHATSSIQAFIEETGHDQAGRTIKKTQYAAPLIVNDEEQLTAGFIAENISGLARPDKDHVLYYWYDEASQERLRADQSGHVVKKDYDDVGRMVAETKLFNPVDGPAAYLNQRFDKLPITPDAPRDRTTCYIYDRCGRVHFIIAPNGQVVRKDHDENDNVVQTCTFKAFVPAAQNYQDLSAQLNSWVPDANQGAITKTAYDKADRVVSITGALQHTDRFKRDALGNALTHTNRAGQTWQYEFDRANRLIRETSPETTVSTVTIDSNGKLVCTDTRASIKKKTDFDKDGNAVCVTQGEGTPDARIFQAAYAPNNQLYTTTIQAVVDAPDQAANLTVPPVQLTTLTTQLYYNAKGQKIAQGDEANNWSYFIYGPLGRMVYKITNNTVAVKLSYNAFDQLVEEHHYASALTLDFSAYRKTGVPETLLAQSLLISPEDRKTTYQYDAAGNVTTQINGPIFYYVDEAHYGTDSPTTEKKYNTFGDCIYEKIFFAPGQYVEKYTWYDQLGHVAAEADEKKYLKRYFFDAAGRVVRREEHAGPLNGPVSVTTTLEELDKLMARPSPDDEIQDRIITFEYDLLGQKTKETQVAKTVQDLKFDDAGAPTIVDLPKQDHFTGWTYTSLQTVESVRCPDGNRSFTYYDERGLKSSEVQVPRKSSDEQGRPILITPKTVFKRNAFGQVVSTIESADTQVVQQKTEDEDFVVVSTSLIDEDWVDLGGQTEWAEELFLYDGRGLLSIQQNAEGHRSMFTYTADCKPARKIEQGSRWTKPTSDTYAQELCVDEIRYDYDLVNRITVVSKLRNNQTEENLFSRYDVFGQLRGQGENGMDWPMMTKADAMGLTWSSNADGGVNTISLYDLRGQETLRLQSDVDDLSLQAYDNLPSLLTNAGLERTERSYDACGKLVSYKAPFWYQKKGPLPTRAYQYDHWGNVVKETDSMGLETHFVFNGRDQLIKRTRPAVQTIQDDGSSVQMPLVTRYAYNARGFAIGKIGAKGQQTCKALDDAGQMLKHYQGDGAVNTARIYNARGFVTAVMDARQHKDTYDHDALGNVKAVHFSSGRSFQYEYDAKGNRVHTIDAAAFHTYYSYDARNNLYQRTLHLGHTTKMDYDRNGQTVRIENPDGSFSDWERDWFSTVIGHHDLGQRNYNYEYDKKRQLLHQSAKGGPARARYKVHYLEQDGQYGPHCKLTAPDATAIDIAYAYQFGREIEVSDNMLGQATTKQYDSEGRIEQAQIKDITDGRILRTMSSQYDEVGREKSSTDEHCTTLLPPVNSKMIKNTTYDAANNRRHEQYILHPARYTEKCDDDVAQRDVWSAYDAADRIVVANGSFINNAVQITPKNGVEFHYDHGHRSEERYYSPDGSILMATKLDYNADGQLSSTSAAVTNFTTTYQYHPDGHVQQYDEYSAIKQITNCYEYSANLWPVNTESWKNGDYTKTTYWVTSLGLPYYVEVSQTNFLSDFSINYVNLESPIVSSITGGGNDPSSQLPGFSGTGEFYYDNNGTPNAKINAQDETGHFPVIPGHRPSQIVYFETSSDGLVLSKTKFGSVMEKLKIYLLPTYHYQFFYNAKGQLQGGYETLTTDALDDYYRDYKFHYTNDRRPVDGRRVEHVTLTRGNIQPHFYNRFVLKSVPTPDGNKNKPFGNSYYLYSPPTDPQIYIVQAKDTLASISNKLYGEKIYANKLGEINGYLIKQTLAAGQMLFLPQIIPARNKADCARPYNEFISLISGNVVPHMVCPYVPILDDDDDDSIFGFIAKVIGLGIVLSVAPFLATGLLTAIGYVGATAAVTSITTGVMAAIGDAALQGVAVGLHIQSKFSINEVLETAVSAGVGESLELAKAGLAARALAVSTSVSATQLIEMKAGWRTKFDAMAVALQVAATLTKPAIEAGVSKLNLQDATASYVVNTTAYTATNSLLGSAAYGTPPNIQYMAANALGTMIADQASGKLIETIKNQDQMKAQILNDSNYSNEMEQAEAVANMPLPDPILPLPGPLYGEASNALSQMNSDRALRWQQESANRRTWANKTNQAAVSATSAASARNVAITIGPNMASAPGAAQELIAAADNIGPGSTSWINNMLDTSSPLLDIAGDVAAVAVPGLASAAIRYIGSELALGGPLAEAETLTGGLGGAAAQATKWGGGISDSGGGLWRKMGLFNSKLNLLDDPLGTENFSEATSRLQLEKLKTQYRQNANWKNPIEINNSKLQEVVDNLYRENAVVGSGSTADAVRVEGANPGVKVGSSLHVQKATESVRALDNLLNNANLLANERMIAENIRLDLLDALGNKLWYSQTNTPKL